MIITKSTSNYQNINNDQNENQVGESEGETELPSNTENLNGTQTHLTRNKKTI